MFLQQCWAFALSCCSNFIGVNNSRDCSITTNIFLPGTLKQRTCMICCTLRASPLQSRVSYNSLTTESPQVRCRAMIEIKLPVLKQGSLATALERNPRVEDGQRSLTRYGLTLNLLLFLLTFKLRGQRTQFLVSNPPCLNLVLCWSSYKQVSLY